MTYHFSHINNDPKTFFCCILGNIEKVCFRQITFVCTHFRPKRPFFGLLRGCFWPKTWKVFSDYTFQKITFWNPNMAPKKFNNFWSHRPLDPPCTVYTPPPQKKKKKKNLQGSKGGKNGHNAFTEVKYLKVIAKKQN